MVLDPSNPDHAAVEERLRDELIVWLTTVSPDGQPQSSPVWFLWNGEVLFIYSQPRQWKLRNIVANARVSLNLRGTRTGGKVVILEGRAEVADDAEPADRIPEYVTKYAEEIEALGWTPSSFAADYSRPIRITPTRLRVW